MGKGDKKSKRGKIHIGSTGISRPAKKRKKKKVIPLAPGSDKEGSAGSPETVAAPAKKTARKAAVKKKPKKDS
jgi:ribosomal small subunit protein bTHX